MLGPRLEGERIYLRTLTASDANAHYVAWLADHLVNRYLETRHSAQTQASIAAFIKAKNESKTERLFGIFLHDDDRHIGNIKLGPVRLHHLLADVSLFIGDRPSWSRGYGSEAVLLISQYALETLELNKLQAGMYAANSASVRAFEKVGWQIEARLPQHYLLEGKPSEIVLMGLTRTQAARR